MTSKIEAIKQLMLDYNGVATWELIYNEIEKYYPDAKKSREWQAGLRGVLYRDLGKGIKRIDDGVYALIDYDLSELLPYQKEAINKKIITEREIYVRIRTAQTKFREKLIKKHKCCPITLIEEPRLLIASHIKPWALSTPKERIDVNNGFLFTPNIDKLFDTGLITFTDKKEIIFSNLISKETIKKLNLENGIYKMLPTEDKLEYLEFHRNKIFRKKLIHN